MKTSFRFAISAAVSTALPVVLFLATSYRNGHIVTFREWELIGINWLFMAAPHVLVVGLALVHKPFQHGLAPGVLLSLCLLLAVFQGWVWWFVPPRESGLARILYIPLWLSVFVAFYVYHQLIRRSRKQRPGL